LIYFEAEPIEDEVMISELYKKQFLSFDRSSRLRTDTFWTRTIPYKQFKEGLIKYNMPLHKLTAISLQSDLFPKLQEGIIKIITSNNTLFENVGINKKMQIDEEKMLVSSIDGLDTLRNVYNEQLRQRKGIEAPSSTTNLNVIDRALSKSAPELEL